MEGVSGLRPKTWIAIGAGYSREDIKALFLARGQALIADAITDLESLALRLVTQGRGGRPPVVLEPVARQEVLRMLLAEPRISGTMPELKRLRRQNGFFRRLDQAFQAGRLAVAHAEEARVYQERLMERLGGEQGQPPLRSELERLARAYEAWMGAQEFYDLPLLLTQAIEILQQQGWSGWHPQKILHLSLAEPESLEKSFWEALGSLIPVERPVMGGEKGLDQPPVTWERWHTLDDACDRLAECLAQQGAAHASIATEEEPLASVKNVVLIADYPSLRRSMKRALKQWGIAEAEPRDPQFLKTDESLKEALLPFEVIAGNFERTRVLAYLNLKCARGQLLPSVRDAFLAEINARGIRQGLSAYQGGKLEPVALLLEELKNRFGGKKKISVLSAEHLLWLRDLAGEGDWRPDFFEAVWAQFIEDYERLGLLNRSAALLYWLERLEERIAQAPPPIERLKPRRGLRVYRLQQAVPLGLEEIQTLWVLGMPSHWFSTDGMGDYWYSERDREILAQEFAVRSGLQIRSEKTQAFQGWLSRAREVCFLDAQYDAEGREQESLLTALREWGFERDGSVLEVQEKGAHSRWLASFNAARPLPPQEVQLAPLEVGTSQGGVPEISATTLEHYSRCSFQALVMDRWRLRDFREPEPELWPDVKGNLLHEAVRVLLLSRSDEGDFRVSSVEALDQAWKKKYPHGAPGMLRSERVERYIRRRLLQVLDAFKEKELQYLKRSGAQIVSLDEKRFRLNLGHCTVVGQPDRIDRVSGQAGSGLFLMDYKTSTALPNGTEMVEMGYRLQLPFYALAAAQEMNEPVLGVQFIELSNQGRRSNGIFFEAWNGKDPGKLTQVTRASKSLLKVLPDEAWSQLRGHLESHSKAYIEGRFAARPKKEGKECDRCSVADLCGFRRKVSDGLAGVEGEGSDE